MYDDIRQHYIPNDLCNSKSPFDFYNTLGQHDCNVIRKISNFIFYMLKKIISQYVNSVKPICLYLQQMDTLPFNQFVKWRENVLYALNGRLMETFLLRTQNMPHGGKWKCVLSALEGHLIETFLLSTQSKHFDGK